MSAKTETWHLLFHMWLNKKDNKTLEYFACSENYEVIYKYLRPLPLDYTYHIMPHYHTKSFLSIIARHARQTRILCLILNHFKEIKPRYLFSTFFFVCTDWKYKTLLYQAYVSKLLLWHLFLQSNQHG